MLTVTVAVERSSSIWHETQAWRFGVYLRRRIEKRRHCDKDYDAHCSSNICGPRYAAIKHALPMSPPHVSSSISMQVERNADLDLVCPKKNHDGSFTS